MSAQIVDGNTRQPVRLTDRRVLTLSDAWMVTTRDRSPGSLWERIAERATS